MNTQGLLCNPLPCIKGLRYNKIRERFTRKFHRIGPTDKAIDELVNKFERAGSIQNVLDSKWRLDSKYAGILTEHILKVLNIDLTYDLELYMFLYQNKVIA